MTEMILCPTRGGKASYPNQDRAIALAKERDVGLLFLYVTDVRFLGLTAAPKVVDIETKLDEMGDFLLAMAQERAQKSDVKAYTLVQRGEFREVLKDVIREYPISTVILGSSSQGSRVITPEYVEKLRQEISIEMGVEFIVVHDGEIESIYKAET
jgi:nucleotide-binding universal stress UspA family protein